MLSHLHFNPLPPLRNLVLAGLLGLGLAPARALGAEQPAPGLLPFQHPAWLTDLSLGVKESWDSNVYLSGVEPRLLPSSFVLVPGSAAALKDLTSWVTTVSPKVGVDFVPLLGWSNTLQVLSFGYAPEFAIYHNEPVENDDIHRFALAAKGQTGNFQFNVDNSFNYVDGSTIAPTYPGVFLSAYATAAPRERREQYQDRGKFVFQYNLGDVFVRPTASLLYYNMLTLLTNVPGYQNYPDRTDVNGGADLGYKVTPDIATTLGYRYGHVYQEQFSFDLHSATCDYQRVLVGLEGKAWKWLTFSLQGGPDFRDYGPTVPDVHIIPVPNRRFVTYYGEANIVATLTTADSLTFKYKAFQWASSIGRGPYFDSLYDLGYRHKFGPKLVLDAAFRLGTADYTSGNLPTSLRNDWMYTTSLGLTYAFTSQLSANVAYSVDLGRNAQDDIVNPQGREFNRHLVSLGLLLKF